MASATAELSPKDPVATPEVFVVNANVAVPPLVPTVVAKKPLLPGFSDNVSDTPLVVTRFPNWSSNWIVTDVLVEVLFGGVVGLSVI
jgi:hypothetical protein